MPSEGFRSSNQQRYAACTRHRYFLSGEGGTSSASSIFPLLIIGAYILCILLHSRDSKCPHTCPLESLDAYLPFPFAKRQQSQGRLLHLLRCSEVPWCWRGWRWSFPLLQFVEKAMDSRGQYVTVTNLNNALFTRETLQNHHAFTLFHSPQFFGSQEMIPRVGGRRGKPCLAFVRNVIRPHGGMRSYNP